MCTNSLFAEKNLSISALSENQFHLTQMKKQKLMYWKQNIVKFQLDSVIFHSINIYPFHSFIHYLLSIDSKHTTRSWEHRGKWDRKVFYFSEVYALVGHDSTEK